MHFVTGKILFGQLKWLSVSKVLYGFIVEFQRDHWWHFIEDIFVNLK